jgi:heme-degrading monooxygenase HmoA
MSTPTPDSDDEGVLEVAVLDVVPGLETAFEAAFDEARAIITATPGYLGHQLKRCLEQRSRYLLLVRWTHLEAHTVAFRGSPGYQRWKALLHRFYDPFPVVEHYVARDFAREVAREPAGESP